MHPFCFPCGKNTILFLDLHLGFHDKFSLVVPAFGTDPVRQHIGAALGAGTQIGYADGMMGPSHS
jgi:hypothetical protein